MIEYNPDQLKYHISQRYGIPEAEIDESLLALYVLMDKQNDSSKEALSAQKKEIKIALDEIKNVQDKKAKTIIYDNPTTAFMGNLAAKGLLGIGISIFLIIGITAFNNWQKNRELIQNYQNLKEHVKVTPEGYFIEKGSYTVQKNGILIKIE